MANEVKKDTTIGEEQQGAPVNPDKKDETAKQPGKIKSFFSKNAGKIKAGLAIAGAVGVGVAADRLGIKLGSKKKEDDSPADPE